jgi:hypothetical protein
MTATHHTNTTTTDRNHPDKVMPEHLSTSREPRTKEEKIDAQMEDSFPASDPPSYSGGNHAIGAPSGRESEAPAPDSHAVTEAEKKVKSGDAAKPETY